MEMPSVEEMIDAMSSPVIPMDAIREEEQSEDMKTQTDMLLDIIKSVARLEDKVGRMNSGGGSANVTPDPNLFGVTSGQLEF
jgi:hypothetical protein